MASELNLVIYVSVSYSWIFKVVSSGVSAVLVAHFVNPVCTSLVVVNSVNHFVHNLFE